MPTYGICSNDRQSKIGLLQSGTPAFEIVDINIVIFKVM